MAVLKQSELWPIHSARRLHDQAQQSFMWQFLISGAVPAPDEEMMLLAQSCSIPPIAFERKSFKVNGQEKYYLGQATRGGAVNVTFVEVEGGKVDTFFRLWANMIDVPLTGADRAAGVLNRWRRGKGFGDGLTGYARYGIVRLLKRDGSTGVEFVLSRLLLTKFAGYNLSYEGSGPLTLSVEMSCDDVVRNVFA